MTFNFVSFLWNCHCRLFNMAKHLRQTCFIVSNMKWVLIRTQAVSLGNWIKLMKVNRGKKLKGVSAFCWTGFHGSMSFFSLCVLCICVYEFVWMGTYGCVYSCAHVDGDQRYCVTFFIIVSLSFRNRLYCWIWTSPSWLATKCQESFRFCLLHTRIIGTCIAPGFHVGAENLNSGHLWLHYFLDLLIFYVVAFWVFLRETKKDVWNVTCIHYIKLNISVRITTWKISIFKGFIYFMYIYLHVYL